MDDFLESLSDVRKNIIEDCMTALGYPVVSLFITQEQINRLIDMAVRKCSGKACPRFLQTFYVGNGVVDVSEYNMTAVVSVYSSSGVGGTPDCEGSCSGLSTCDICDKLCSYRAYSYGLLQGSWNNSLYNQLAYQSAKSEQKSLELSDYYLDVGEGKLYLDNYTGTVTVEYTKGSVVLEDLKNDSYWLSWISDYTLALTKITEGRIRGKYKATSGVFEIEADELISEGNTDKQDLEEKLNEEIGYWNILRG